jgi:hypothetical protein
VADHGYTLFGPFWRVGGVATKWANRASTIGHGMTDGWDIEHASAMGCELDVHSHLSHSSSHCPIKNQKLYMFGRYMSVDGFSATASRWHGLLAIVSVCATNTSV